MSVQPGVQLGVQSGVQSGEAELSEAPTPQRQTSRPWCTIAPKTDYWPIYLMLLPPPLLLSAGADE